MCGHYKSINIDEAGYLAQETVKRVIRGIQSADGSVVKYTIEKPNGKGLRGPQADKMVRSYDFELRGI